MTFEPVQLVEIPLEALPVSVKVVHAHYRGDPLIHNPFRERMLCRSLKPYATIPKGIMGRSGFSLF